MSDLDITKEYPANETKPPIVDVARPDIPPPPVDSLGRSMANKRGRKPKNVQTADSNAEPNKQLQKEISKRLPAGALLTDENVGKALAGAFAAIGIFRGGHWRLFAQEEAQLGEVFGPYARLYGSDELGKWISILMILPVATSILMPRIAVERMVMTGAIDKNEGRKTLLQIKAMSEAEKSLNIEQIAKEKIAYLKAQAGVAAELAVQMKASEEQTEGVVSNGAQG